ncbi:MAG: cytochrome C oxidase subunit IV family protein [Rhodothermales bacterium]
MKSQHGHHIVPKGLLYKVFGILVVLTILTAVTAQVNLGGFNVPLALAIAVSKATLVVMFFMALKYDKPVNTLVFMLGIVFAAVFLIFTLLDTAFRGDIGNVGKETISDVQRREEVMRQREAAFRSPQAPQAAAVDTSIADTTSAEVDTTAADTTQ